MQRSIGSGSAVCTAAIGIERTVSPASNAHTGLCQLARGPQHSSQQPCECRSIAMRRIRGRNCRRRRAQLRGGRRHAVALRLCARVRDGTALLGMCGSCWCTLKRKSDLCDRMDIPLEYPYCRGGRRCTIYSACGRVAPLHGCCSK